MLSPGDDPVLMPVLAGRFARRVEDERRTNAWMVQLELFEDGALKAWRENMGRIRKKDRI
jgi:hypothetical protein